MEKNDPSPYAQKLEQMLGERGAYDGENDAYAVLYRIALDLLTECSALRATEDNLRAQIGHGEQGIPAGKLTPVIQWLEAGCEPKHAAIELRILASAPPAPQAESANRPSADWYKAKIMETLDDDFHIGPAPQQKPLTDEQIKQAAGAGDEYWATSKLFILAIARAIEAAHNIGEKK